MKLSKIKVLRTPQALLSITLQLSILLLSVAYPLLSPQKANATVTEGFVRFDRLSTGAAISGTACLKSTLTTQTNVVIVFPAGWTISSTASNWTTSTTNLPTDPVGGTAATAWPGIGTASSVVGLSVVFPGTALAAGTFYCFNFTGASSTVGSAGNDLSGQLKTQGGAPYTDSINYATSVVASGAEQVTITASVSATMTFSLSGNSIALGTLSSGTTTNGSVVESVITNARNGWTSWIKGTNGSPTIGSLHSAAANADIAAPAAWPTVSTLSSTGGYVIDVDSTAGTPTIAAGYAGGTADQGGAITTLFKQIATKTTPTSIAQDQVTINARARAASTQAAGSDYTDTLTVTAAGSF
jgi:hypothetical protein